MAIQGTIGSNPSQLRGKMGKKDSIQAKSMTYTPTMKMSDLTDIDITDRDEGSIIIYDEATETFKVKSTLENANTYIVGGSF